MTFDFDTPPWLFGTTVAVTSSTRNHYLVPHHLCRPYCRRSFGPMPFLSFSSASASERANKRHRRQRHARRRRRSSRRRHPFPHPPPTSSLFCERRRNVANCCCRRRRSCSSASLRPSPVLSFCSVLCSSLSDLGRANMFVVRSFARSLVSSSTDSSSSSSDRPASNRDPHLSIVHSPDAIFLACFSFTFLYSSSVRGVMKRTQAKLGDERRVLSNHKHEMRTENSARVNALECKRKTKVE